MVDKDHVSDSQDSASPLSSTSSHTQDLKFTGSWPSDRAAHVSDSQDSTSALSSASVRGSRSRIPEEPHLTIPAPTPQQELKFTEPSPSGRTARQLNALFKLPAANKTAPRSILKLDTPGDYAYGVVTTQLGNLDMLPQARHRDTDKMLAQMEKNEKAYLKKDLALRGIEYISDSDDEPSPDKGKVEDNGSAMSEDGPKKAGGKKGKGSSTGGRKKKRKTRRSQEAYK